MKFLLVDDLIDTRRLYELVFRLAGHTVHTGTNGLEAVEAVHKESYDMLIIDVEMPLMNGWDAVKCIRELENGKRLPIIMFTAYDTGIEQEQVDEVGGDLLVHKPILPSVLLLLIDTLIEERKAIE